MSSPTKVELTGGHFQDSAGNVLAGGTLVMELVQDEQLSMSTGQVCGGIKVTINLDSAGSVDTSPAQSVWPTDIMNPGNASYTVWGYTAEGQLAWGPNYNLLVPSGSTYDVDGWVPNSVNNGSGSGGSNLLLQTNGVNNGSQSKLNLYSSDSSVTLTDDDSGNIDFQVSLTPVAGNYFQTNPTANTTTQSTDQAGANGIYLYVLDVNVAVSFDKISVAVADADTGGTLSDIGIYSLTGTLLANIGATDSLSNTTVYSFPTLQGTVTLQPGRYLFAITANANSGGFVFNFNDPVWITTTYQTSDHSSAGVLPATITVTVVNNFGYPGYSPGSGNFPIPLLVLHT